MWASSVRNKPNERLTLKRPQGLSPRTKAECLAKAAKVYISHLSRIESAAAKHFAARGPPTALGTNPDDLAWLERNKTSPGVVSLPCGLQYKVLRQAKVGAKSPKFDTPVEVHYRGKLLSNGKQFYCSYDKAAEPERHVPNKIIQGWSVALQLMGSGDKWLLFLPAELAYGDVGSTNGWQHIPPHAALTFELELVAVRSDTAPVRVQRPAGMTTEELVAAAAAAAAGRPATASATCTATCMDENSHANKCDGDARSSGATNCDTGGLFDRPAVSFKRGEQASDRLSSRPCVSSATPSKVVQVQVRDHSPHPATTSITRPLRPTGYVGAATSGTGQAAAEQAATEQAATAEALAAENAELRASLERATERALQWQERARSLAQELEALQEQHRRIMPAPTGDIGGEELPETLDVECGEEPTRTVVLVGVTGGGKSSLGSVLSGCRGGFRIGDGFSSATAQACHADFASMERLVAEEIDAEADERRAIATQARRIVTRVVDTVGLHDTSLPAAVAMVRFGSAFSAEGGHVPPAGADLFFFVMPFGRFSSSVEAALTAFIACCGEEALEHTVLVFTHCMLSQNELKQELMASAPPSLRRVLPRLAFPSVLGVDVVARPNASLHILRTAIQEAIQALNGARYSRDALHTALDEYGGGQDEEERAAFAAAVADWRKAGDT